MLCNSAASRGDCPQGVDFHKSTGKFRARIRIYGKRKNLGVFDTIEDASAVYLMAKYNHIIEVADSQSDIRVKDGLIGHAKLMMK